MATYCYDCVYLGRRTVGSAEVRCEHPSNRGKPDKERLVTIETESCDKVFYSHKAREVIALEEIRERLYRT